MIKITDFGLSKFTEMPAAGAPLPISTHVPNTAASTSSGPISNSAAAAIFHTACGTPGYVAPEVLEQKVVFYIYNRKYRRLKLQLLVNAFV